MKVLATFAIAASALTVAVRMGAAQVTSPLPLPFVEDGNPCPAYGPGSPSASNARCAASESSRQFIDGGNHLFASVGSFGGYDSAFSARRNLGAAFEGGAVSAGLISLKPRSFNLFENTASVADYLTPKRTLLYLDSATISLTHLPSARTTLSLDANNIFGNDAVRAFALDGSTKDIESPTYAITAGRILDNQVTVRLSRESSETRWWSASIRNNFRDLMDTGTRINTLHGRAEIHYQPTAQAGIGLFEETSVQTGVVDCRAQSVGILYERRIRDWLAVEGSGAPSIGSRGCVSRLTANLYGAFSAQPGRSTIIWVSGRRGVNDSQIATLSYENNAQGGWMQQFGLNGWFKLRGGWIGGTTPSRTLPFSGLFVSSSFGYRLPGGLTASISAQDFHWSGIPNIAPTRTMVTASLYWSPSRNTPDNLRGLTEH